MSHVIQSMLPFQYEFNGLSWCLDALGFLKFIQPHDIQSMELGPREPGVNKKLREE